MMKKLEMFRMILIVFLLIVSPAIYAQDSAHPSGGIPGVSIEASPRTPEIGVPWLLTLLVDHNVPDEVTVIAPQFASQLFMDRLVKTPRVADSRLQTVVQYRFIPNAAGRFLIESFTVITPYGNTETEPFVLEIPGPAVGQSTLSPRIIWEGVPTQMAAGERAVIALRITDSSAGFLPQEFFMPEVPRGAIIEALPLTAEERSRGVAIKLNLIPLENFRLPARILRFENSVFEIPALNIRVTSAASRDNTGEPQKQTAAFTTQGEKSSDNIHVPFPDFDLAPPSNFLFGKIILEKVWYAQCENIYNTVRDLWDSGLYAQALAELRQNERDHPAGALLRTIRMKAEENLVFFKTENENRWRRKLLLGLSFLIFFLVIIVPLAYFTFIRNSLKKRVVLVCAVFFAMVVFFYIYIFLDSQSAFSGNDSRFGVTNKTPVRRTADIDGEELFSFREGQPVVIMLDSGTWIFVRTNDSTGSSGWIPAEKVIFY